MDKAMGRLILVVGTVLYVITGVLALLTYIWNVEFFGFAALGIALQVAVAVPMVGFLLGRMKLTVVDYAKWLLALSVALAVSGYLGVPAGSSRAFPQVDALKAKAEAIEASDLGGRERLELKVDLAAADSDDEKKTIKEKIDKIADSISKEDRKEAEQDIAVLRAKARLATVTAQARQSSLYAAEKRSGIMLLSAFILFAGAWLMSRENI